MGLTGLEIYKQLPKKNCGECGPPTCLAFAMALASGKASLDSCPYVSDEAKENLDAASAPPIKLVKVGTGDAEIELGDETELFRHDKTFYHPTGVGFLVSDKLSTDEINAKVEEINSLEFERVGLEYKVDFVVVKCDSGDAGTYKAAVEAVVAKSKQAFILYCEDAGILEQALAVVADKKPLIYPATENNHEAMTKLAKDNSVPLGVKGNDLNSLAELVQKISKEYKELVIDSGNRETSQTLEDLVQMRRQAIKKKFRPFGYPIMVFATEGDSLDQALQAQVYVSKYASITVIDTTNRADVLALLTWRQNIYTDPQKPIQVEEKVYEVGEVTPDSPVYLTTNFSLTYYSVEGEVEASKIPSYIIPIDTDGTSVLTAWAAGKYEGDKISETLKRLGIEEKVNHRNIVIPGYVAVISGKLNEASGWNVIVGPREASGIPAFAKSQFS
ncbi:acetyl-CoA decarbonylase/synthase complex subunit gamma [Desulfitispora alkaliphila]|uniref:acetyl-CoA decarbonylase/synthase complex subunit gamma n=1 Tax=Desulfitispora alkaliphila TaxID=622674 RepID=UPI003D1C1FE0